MPKFEYLPEVLESTDEVVIHIFRDGKEVTAPRYPLEQFSSKEEIDAFISNLEAQRLMNETSEKLEADRKAALKAERLAAIGTLPTKPKEVNVESKVLEGVKERIVEESIKTGATLEEVKAQIVEQAERLELPFDASKIEFSEEEIQVIDKKRPKSEEPA